MRDLAFTAAVLHGDLGRFESGVEKLRGGTDEWAWNGVALFCRRRAKTAPEARFA